MVFLASNCCLVQYTQLRQQTPPPRMVCWSVELQIIKPYFLNSTAI
jgi:hypothetical protein